MTLLRGLYDWTLALGASRHAVWALALVAFIESSFFPIPPDIMLIPMVLAVRQRAWFLAGLCTIASVAGGYLGYAIGAVLFDTIGQPIIDLYTLGDSYISLREQFTARGAEIVAFFGLTVLPYKLITITAGFTQLNLWEFGLASVVSRGARFFIVAGLLWYFGDPIKAFVERYLGWVVTAFCVLLVGGFVVLKFLL